MATERTSFRGMNMSEKISSRPAAGSGTISLGGELTVNRLGFGAMRLTGDGIWGPPKDPRKRNCRPSPGRRVGSQFHRYG